MVTLPGAGRLGVYQPRHARPETGGAGERPATAGRKRAKKGGKKGAKKISKKVGKPKPTAGAVKKKKKAKKMR